MLPSVRDLPPISPCVNSVDNDIIACSLGRKAESNGPSLVVVYPPDLSEIDRDLAVDAFPFRPTNLERRGCGLCK